MLAAAPAARSAGTETEIVALGNALRSAQGLPPLAVDGRLEAAARAFAQAMAQRDIYGHEADGRTPAQRAQAAGYAACAVAENLAWQHSQPPLAPALLAQHFAEGWERSPPHRRNVLDAGLTDVGVAVARSASSGRWYAVQLFGRPQSLRLRFELRNDSGAPLAYRFDGRAYGLDPEATATHEACRAGELSWQLPGREPVRLRPVDGGRYRATAPGGGP